MSALAPGLRTSLEQAYGDFVQADAEIARTRADIAAREEALTARTRALEQRKAELFAHIAQKQPALASSLSTSPPPSTPATRQHDGHASSSATEQKATAIVQLATSDLLSETRPVELPVPLTRKVLLDAASKKFKGVSKSSRVFDGVSGVELQDGPVQLSAGVAVVSGKGGWRGADRLREAHAKRVDEPQSASIFGDEAAWRAALGGSTSAHAAAEQQALLLTLAQSLPAHGRVAVTTDGFRYLSLPAEWNN